MNHPEKANLVTCVDSPLLVPQAAAQVMSQKNKRELTVVDPRNMEDNDK